MAFGSGLAGQFGMVAESVYGTLVTPTRFLEFNTEGLKANLGHLESKGIGSGRYLKTLRHKDYIRDASGPLEMDVMTLGFGLPFQMMLGGYANASVSGTERKHTVQPGTDGIDGDFFTCQVGRPSIDGTVHPFNYEGCKVVDWELKAAIDNWLKLGLNIDAQTEQTSTALASASYLSGARPFSFVDGALTIGGSAVSVRGFSIKGANAIKTDRRFIGNTKKEPLCNGEGTIMGELQFEHEALTRHGQLVAGTELANLILTFDTGVAISGGSGNYKLVVTIAAFYFLEGPKNVGGPDVITETMQFKAINDGSNPVIKLEYYNTESAA